VAFLGATIFETDPATATEISIAGMIHTASGLVVVLGFPITATLIGWSRSRNNTWISTRLWLLLVTLLVWLGWLSFRTILMADQGMLGPTTAAGWPNRFMMATYTIWLFAVAWLAQRRSG
jgi:biotin transporter BioY